jgi:hypothetical protein
MPPPKTIIVNHDALLAAVAREEAKERAWLAELIPQLQAEWEASRANYEIYGSLCRAKRDLETADWVPRDLVLLAGRQLTPSERKRWQQSVVQLEREGLLETATRHLRLTAAGRARLAPAAADIGGGI